MTQKRFTAANGLDANSKTITNLTDPTNAQDAATKAFSSNANNLASGTIPAAQMPAHTGDVTSAEGSVGLTLPTVNSNVGSFTLASLTVNAKGQVTAVSSGGAIAGGLVYKGIWNASTNSPALASASSATLGWYYKVGTAGTTDIDGNSSWTVGDMIISNGTTYDKLEGGTADVSSVVGQVGAITTAQVVAAVMPLATIGTPDTAFTTSTITANQLVDGTLSSTIYRSAFYQVQITSGSVYQSCQLNVVHDGTNAWVVEFANISSGVSLATFDAALSGGFIRLLTTPTNAVTTYKVLRTAITI